VINLLEGIRWVSPHQELFLVGQPHNLEALGWKLAPHERYLAPLSHESHPAGDLWEHFWLPGILRRHQVDVFHGPATLIPLTQGRYGSVVTVHDLVAFVCPETVPHKYAIYMRWLLRRVVQRADQIICVSENTKRDLVQVLGVDPARITVVYLAAPAAFQPFKDAARLEWVRRRYGLSGPYIYHVGNIEPRKNLVRLVKAYLLLRQRLSRRVRLVISGQKGWLTGLLFRELSGLELGDDVVFTGYVPRSDLPLLMSAAELFVFPSLYEGFGLPALEAMCCGTPVVTSNISSLPEIVGSSAVLVDPLDEEGIANGMQRVLEDQDLRQRLVREGLARSKLFSWENTARQTLEVYRRAKKGGAGG
jgi:glycosyltransferase involved in cell wall biosynthesis